MDLAKQRPVTSQHPKGQLCSLLNHLNISQHDDLLTHSWTCRARQRRRRRGRIDSRPDRGKLAAVLHSTCINEGRDMIPTAAAASRVSLPPHLPVLVFAATAAAAQTIRIGTANASPTPASSCRQARIFPCRRTGCCLRRFRFGRPHGRPARLGSARGRRRALSAGLFNAIARGIEIRIVADKGSTPPATAISRSWSARPWSTTGHSRR